MHSLAPLPPSMSSFRLLATLGSAFSTRVSVGKFQQILRIYGKHGKTWKIWGSIISLLKHWQHITIIHISGSMQCSLQNAMTFMFRTLSTMITHYHYELSQHISRVSQSMCLYFLFQPLGPRCHVWRGERTGDSPRQFTRPSKELLGTTVIKSYTKGLLTI